jgi:glycosyltransferase involved in cell wall biosynthesis
MNILYVTPYIPSRIRTRPYHLIRALLDLDHQVTLLTAGGGTELEQAEVKELRSWGMHVEVFPVSRPRSLLNCLWALPTREPLQAVFSYHPQMARRMGELLRENSFDVTHIEHLRAARLVRFTEDRPVVYDSVDCISLLFEQAAQSGAQLRSRLMTILDLARTRRYEAHLLTRFDQVVVTSQRDQDAMEELARHYLPPDATPAPVSVVTNGVDLDYFQRPKNEDIYNVNGIKGNPDISPKLIFTGKMSYHANVAAALYFAQDVLPLIWEHDPSVRFQIVGKDPPERVRRLAADERIEVTGTVNDLRPYLAQAAAAVCPARYAVGIQNKVLEAMAMGAPVVSTPAGAPALAVEEEALLVAYSAAEFAAAVLRVLADPDLAQHLSSNGQRYVETYHSWKSAARRLVAVYQRAGSVPFKLPKP